MGFKEWIIPQGDVFFLLLERQSENNMRAAREFGALIGDFSGMGQKRERMHALEHKGDRIVHEILSRLNETLVTPIEHEDIERLASKQDDVIDYLFAITNRIYIYKVRKPTPAMGKFADIIGKQVAHIDEAVHDMRRPGKKGIELGCMEVHKLENAADDLLYNEIAGLFRLKNPIEVIKLKDIYEYLEIATDKCEDVSDILLDIRMKYS